MLSNATEIYVVAIWHAQERRSSLVNIFIDIVLGTIGSAITVYCASVIRLN